jgi:hypothetical protein
MSSSSTTESEKMSSIVANSHLLADGQPHQFLELADLQVALVAGDEITFFPCHSSLLARGSKFFGDMFLSTPKEGWASGVVSMFAGHQMKTIELVLAMMHGSCDVSSMLAGMGFHDPLDLDELEDLLRLVHKLDAPKMMNVRWL